MLFANFCRWQKKSYTVISIYIILLWLVDWKTQVLPTTYTQKKKKIGSFIIVTVTHLYFTNTILNTSN